MLKKHIHNMQNIVLVKLNKKNCYKTSSVSDYVSYIINCTSSVLFESIFFWWLQN